MTYPRVRSSVVSNRSAYSRLLSFEDENIPDYISGGIPEIAFEKQIVTTVVTPYGSFPLFLVDGACLFHRFSSAAP